VRPKSLYVKTAHRSRIAGSLVAAFIVLTLGACSSTGSASPSTSSRAATSTSQTTVPTTTKTTSPTATTEPSGTGGTSAIGAVTSQISTELGALQTLLSQTTADFQAGQQDG
jgi:hypothetical protein